MENIAKIIQIRAWLVDVPLLEEWASSLEFGEHPSGTPRLILCLRDSDGIEGWGEATVSVSWDFIDKTLSLLLGRPIVEFRPAFLDLWEPESQYWQRPTAPSPYAPNLCNLQYRLRHPMQTIVEMALSDLLAKQAGAPLYQLYGGAWRDKIPTDYWMGRTTPEHARKCVSRAVQYGFHGIKLKTTLEDPNIERLEAIHDIAPNLSVTVDANGRFYRMGDAWPTIKKMDQIGNMAVLEDPFPRFHLSEFGELKEKINARVVLHVDPPESLWTVLMSKAAGGLNLDSHTQGLFNWRLAAATAEQANLPIWHGSGLDLGIATAAQLHLCASAPNCQLAGDQAGPWLRQSHLLQKDFEIAEGCVLVPRGKGIGVDVNLNELDKYTLKTYCKRL